MEFTGEFFVPDEKFKDLSADRELAIEHLQRYKSILYLVEDKEVLDIASGEGYGSAMLAGKAANVTGVDINAELVEYASKKYKKDNLSFKEGNATAIPLDTASVDVVISFETLEHVGKEDQVRFIQEAQRVLRKDGILIISTPNKKNYSERFNFKNDFHAHELDEDAFVSLLQSVFPQVEVFNQGQEVVSILFNQKRYVEKQSLQVLPVVQEHFRVQGKYLLAVCCKTAEKSIPDISSIVVEGNKTFFDLTERIIELQDHVEELGAWGRRSSTELEQLIPELNKSKEINAAHEKFRQETEMIIREKNDIVRQYEQMGSSWDKIHRQNDILHLQKTVLEEEIKEKNTALAVGLKTITELQVEQQATLEKISSLQVQVDALDKIKEAFNEGVVEKEKLQQQTVLQDQKLTEAAKRIAELTKYLEEQKNMVARMESQKNGFEQRLRHIYESEGWKLLSVYYRMKGKMLPEGSQRYKVLKKWFQALKKNPKAVLPKTLAVNALESGITTDYRLAPIMDAGVEFPVIFPVFDKVEVSIVMPAFNNWEFTRNCLVSIYKHNDGIPFEVIIGDNVSTDDTQRLPEYFQNVTYIRNKENLGYIRNVNNAASKARGKYILTLNNDTTVTEGWLINLVKIMEADPKAGLVGSKLVFPDGILQEAGGIIWKDASGWNYGRGSDPELPEYNYVKEVDYISGASNLIRRELWEKLNGLDLRYVPAYFDDSDLAFGIRSLGYKVIYQPLSVVIHYEGIAHGTDTSTGIKQYQLLNLEKFKQKWKEELKTNQLANGENVFWARDKSQNKKTILVIDHYVPHFDKDAGSRTVFQYLKLFNSLDYNVKFIGDNFFRHEPYTTVLQQMGIEVLYGPWYANHWQEWIKTNQDKFDFILLNRPHISMKYIDFIKANTKAKILYYGHDLHFIRELKQYEVEKKKELLVSADKWKAIEMSLFDKVDIVLTPSIEEKNLIDGLGVTSSVRAIKPYIFDRMPKPIGDFSIRKDILFVGGFTHVPNVDGVQWFVKEIWPVIKKKVRNVKFIIAGSNAPKEITDLSSDDINVKGFISDEELTELYGEIKLVVAPLRYGAGVKGKTVEALYNGIPLVTTEFGVEGLPGKTPFILPHNNAIDFANEVIRLYDLSSEDLASLSKEEVDYIHNHFHFDVVKKEMLDVLATIT